MPIFKENSMLTSDFVSQFSKLEDPRVDNHNSRHKFIDILVLAFVANLCGCDDWVEVSSFCKIKINFFKQILELPNGIPSHDTFGRVFSLIDSEHFEEIFVEWMNQIVKKTNGDIVALDGKTIRGSRKKGSLRGIHLVNAWSCKNNLTLGSVKVDKKENEITVLPKLLKMLDITTCTVTLDAMGCQRKIASQIKQQGADYIFTVKDNQLELKRDIESAFKIVEGRNSKRCYDSGLLVEKGHGRIETRRYVNIPIVFLPHLKDKWEGIRTVTKVTRKRIVNDEESIETLYYISSHAYTSYKIAKGIRKHWNIENCLHWQLDVSFHEDLNRSRAGNQAESLALLRRISLALLKKDIKSKVGIKVKRKKAGWDDTYLLEILKMVGENKKDNCEKSLT